jgi:outer membrane protein OmpA-like peptidoglycan-associated protein
MAGGPCTYETVYGTARIVAQDKDTILAQLDPENRHLVGNTMLMSRLKFSAQQPVSGGVGTIYPAERSIITKGSCSPGGARLLATETYSSEVFVAFDSEGRISEAAERKLGQIARVLKKLSPRWPQLQVAVWGQTTLEGTQEYNLNLGEQHARRATQKLQERGIPLSLITIFSSGEDSCQRMAFFEESDQHGVCLSFSLTHQELEK